MKSQVYDRFGGGLLLLVMLAIAIIAGEAQPTVDETATLDERAPIEDALESDTGLQITVEQERFSEVETILDRPIRIDVKLEETKTPEPDIVDSSDLSAQ